MEEELMMETSFDDEDIYTETGIEEDVENDAISGMEQGFMMGYLSS